MANDFSLSAFLRDLLSDIEGPELSWDFRLNAYAGHFAISIPIKIYGKSRDYLKDRVRRVAEKFGLSVSTIRFQSDHDLILEGTFLDIIGWERKDNPVSGH